MPILHRDRDSRLALMTAKSNQLNLATSSNENEIAGQLRVAELSFKRHCVYNENR